MAEKYFVEAALAESTRVMRKLVYDRKLRARVQLAYAIGVAEPVSFVVATFWTEMDSKRDVAQTLAREFDLRPQGIIDQRQLLRPIYFDTAAYGHLGRTDLDLPWEVVR